MRRTGRSSWTPGAAGGLVGALVGALVFASFAAFAAALAIGSGYVAGHVTLGQVQPSARTFHVQSVFDRRRTAYTTMQHQLAGFELTEAQFEVDVELGTPPTFDGFDVVGLEDSLAMELAAVVETASPEVGAAAERLRIAARQQLVTMATVASARRTRGHQATALTASELRALIFGQSRLAEAAVGFLTAAHDDLGAALT
jgi:hypothetical protein